MIVANRATLSGIVRTPSLFPCRARVFRRHSHIRLDLSPTLLGFGRMRYRTARARFVRDTQGGPRSLHRGTSITEIMTIRTIIRYPDPRLALAAQPVTAFDGALRDLAQRPARDHARRARDRHHRAAYRHLAAGRGARPRPDRWRADLCQSGDRLGIARDDPASGRQRLDARRQRRHQRVMRASGSAIATSTATCRPRNPRACARSATSMRSISSTACSGSRGCPASSASG